MAASPEAPSQGRRPPYGQILEALHTGKIVPFLGSGASLGGRDPRRAPWGKPDPGIPGRFNATHFPTSSELAEHLAGKATFPEGEELNLSKVAQYYETNSRAREPLDEELRHLFDIDPPVGRIHHYLASIEQPLLIVTTNYDDLLERAFREGGQPFELVVQPWNDHRLLWWPDGSNGEACKRVLPKNLDPDLEKSTVIYKIHGTVDRSTPPEDEHEESHFTITEDDYIEFLTRMTQEKAIPEAFSWHLQELPLLFLGYGLYDWNLRVVLNQLEKAIRQNKQGEPENRYRDDRRPAWSIQKAPSPLEEILWDARGVTVCDLTIEDFMRDLEGYTSQ